MKQLRTEMVIKNLLKVYKEMNKVERSLFQFSVVGLNEQFNNWHNMNEREQQLTIEGFKGIIELSLAGELL